MNKFLFCAAIFLLLTQTCFANLYRHLVYYNMSNQNLIFSGGKLQSQQKINYDYSQLLSIFGHPGENQIIISIWNDSLPWLCYDLGSLFIGLDDNKKAFTYDKFFATPDKFPLFADILSFEDYLYINIRPNLINLKS